MTRVRLGGTATGSNHLERPRLARGRECLVKLAEIVARQSQRKCAVVLANVLRRARLRDRDHSILPKRPGQGHLCRRRPMPNGDPLHSLVSQQSRLFDGRICHDGYIALATPWEQIELDAATAQVVQDLIARDGRTSPRRQDLVHVREFKVAHTPVADLSLLDELRKGADRLMKRRAIAPVQEVEVKMIGAETLEACSARGERLSSLRVTRQDLAHEKDLVAPSVDGFADMTLGGSVPIHLGRVDDRHAEVEAEAQRSDLVGTS